MLRFKKNLPKKESKVDKFVVVGVTLHIYISLKKSFERNFLIFVRWQIVKTSFAGADVSYDAGWESEFFPGDNGTRWHKNISPMSHIISRLIMILLRTQTFPKNEHL